MIMHMSEYAKLKLFKPEYIAWDISKAGRSTIVVIVGLYKLDTTALQHLNITST